MTEYRISHCSLIVSFYDEIKMEVFIFFFFCFRCISTVNVKESVFKKLGEIQMFGVAERWNSKSVFLFVKERAQ